jgi:bruno
MNSFNKNYVASEDSQVCITEESHHCVSQSPEDPVNRKGPDHSDGRNMVPGESSPNRRNDSESSGSYEEDPSNSDREEGIKLFVGQVPKTMDETDLFPVFEKFGPMENITIIRDSNTGQHRGCAFVTFLKRESADACKNELHDKVILDGGKKPVQVKPAGKQEGK